MGKTSFITALKWKNNIDTRRKYNFNGVVRIPRMVYIEKGLYTLQTLSFKNRMAVGKMS